MRKYLFLIAAALLAQDCKPRNLANSSAKEISNGKLRLGQASVPLTNNISYSQFLICNFDRSQCMNPFVYQPSDSKRYMRAQWVNFPYSSEEQIEKIDKALEPYRIAAKAAQEEKLNQSNANFNDAALKKWRADQALTASTQINENSNTIISQAEGKIGILRDEVNKAKDAVNSIAAPDVTPEQMAALETEIRNIQQEIKINSSKLELKEKPSALQNKVRQEIIPTVQVGGFGVLPEHICPCLYSSTRFNLYSGAKFDRDTYHSCEDVGPFDPAICRHTVIEGKYDSKLCNCINPFNVYNPETKKLTVKTYAPGQNQSCREINEDPESCKSPEMAKVWERYLAEDNKIVDQAKGAKENLSKDLQAKQAIWQDYNKKLSDYRQAKSTYDTALQAKADTLRLAELNLQTKRAEQANALKQHPINQARVTEATAAFQKAEAAREAALAPFDLKTAFRKIQIDPNVRTLATNKEAYTAFSDSAPPAEDFVSDGTIESTLKALAAVHGFKLNCRLQLLQPKLAMAIPPCLADSEGEKLFNDYQFVDSPLKAGNFTHPIFGKVSLVSNGQGYNLKGKEKLKINGAIDPCVRGICTSATNGFATTVKLGFLSYDIVAMTFGESGETYLLDRLDSVDEVAPPVPLTVIIPDAGIYKTLSFSTLFELETFPSEKPVRIIIKRTNEATKYPDTTLLCNEPEVCEDGESKVQIKDMKSGQFRLVYKRIGKNGGDLEFLLTKTSGAK